jgi:hypothetical protein
MSFLSIISDKLVTRLCSRNFSNSFKTEVFENPLCGEMHFDARFCTTGEESTEQEVSEGREGCRVVSDGFTGDETNGVESPATRSRDEIEEMLEISEEVQVVVGGSCCCPASSGEWIAVVNESLRRLVFFWCKDELTGLDAFLGFS